MFTDCSQIQANFIKSSTLQFGWIARIFQKKWSAFTVPDTQKLLYFLIKTPALHDTANARCVRLIKKGIICIYFQEFIIYF